MVLIFERPLSSACTPCWRLAWIESTFSSFCLISSLFHDGCGAECVLQRLQLHQGSWKRSLLLFHEVGVPRPVSSTVVRDAVITISAFPSESPIPQDQAFREESNSEQKGRLACCSAYHFSILTRLALDSPTCIRPKNLLSPRQGVRAQWTVLGSIERLDNFLIGQFAFMAS